MTPIEKNILVVDEQGNEYEATYPKRAKGLVKNGRARFISEDKICLACPPDFENLEETNMDKMENPVIKTNEPAQNSAEPITVEYLLEQIRAIQNETAHLHEALQTLANMSDGDSGDCGAPGNILGEAKARAIGEIVRHREETNQQLIALYTKLYDDLRPAEAREHEAKQNMVNQVLALANAQVGMGAEPNWNVIGSLCT